MQEQRRKGNVLHFAGLLPSLVPALRVGGRAVVLLFLSIPWLQLPWALDVLGDRKEDLSRGVMGVLRHA